jgi:hypothetical protein
MKMYLEIWESKSSKRKRMKVLGHKEGVGSYVVGDKNSKGYSHEDLVREEERALRFSMVSRHLRWLQGEVLTVLEAAIDDDRKLKATKDLVKDKFSAKISWVYELCGRPDSEDAQEGLDPENETN